MPCKLTYVERVGYRMGFQSLRWTVPCAFDEHTVLVGVILRDSLEY